MPNKKILLAGGGTGGHVLPLVAVARAVKKLNPKTKIYFMGPEEFSLDSLRDEGIIIKKIIAAGKLRRYFSFLYLWELIKLPWAFIQSFLIIASINPNVVLGKGSYGSVLPVLAAKLLGKKIILHESDAVPGLANRFLSKFTNRITLAFKESEKFFPNKENIIVGNPVRTKYLNLTKSESEDILNLKTDKQTIFISGGSQGAQKINDIILQTLDRLLAEYSIIWSAGPNNYTNVKHRMSNILDLKIAPLLNEKELAAAYTLCDIVIGRAGSGTIFELAAFGKPSILIPLERKGGDQPLNARAYANIGATTILKESELTPKSLLNTINTVLSNNNLLTQMSHKAQEFAKIEAGEDLAKILLNL